MFVRNLKGLKVTYLRNDFDMFCENWSPVSDTSDRGHELVWGGVYYLWLKMADLMDTVGLNRHI